MVKVMLTMAVMIDLQEFRADDIETSDDTVSIATTDVSSAPTDVSSEGKVKVEVKAVKKVLKKRGREDRLQTIMSGNGYSDT